MDLQKAVSRYGAATVIVVSLVMLALLVPAKDRGGDTDVAASGAANATTQDAGTNLAEQSTQVLGATESSLPDGAGFAGTNGFAAADGGAGTSTVDDQGTFVAAKGPCRNDGRQISIERVAPPCVTWLPKADNGGATSPGVTRDKVLIIRFVGQSDPATNAILQGAQLADDPAVVKRAYEALFTYFNQHWQTYGRQVVFQDYEASGPSSNDEQMRSDAVKIATDLKPFAVFGGGKVMATELAARNIICFCTTSLSRDFYTSQPPYLFSTYPTSTLYAEHLGEYIGKKLNNRKADHVGSGFTPTQTAKRKFGLVYLEGAGGKVDPEGKRFKDAMVAAMAKYGAKFGEDDIIGYTYDPGRNQRDITTMMTRLHGDGVTTVVMFVDPLSPILITNEATRQAYFPEWIITGSGLSDTTAAARLYDQSQWRHAFGISPLFVTWSTVAKSFGVRESHHGNPNLGPGDEGVLINVYAQLPRVIFTGIHMAGPKLTPQSFSNGMFAYPRSGGTAATPLHFFTREDPSAFKDFVEIFYDADRPGIDERGLQGNGMVVKMNAGKRYMVGQWTTEPTKAFNDPSALSTSDDPALGGDPDHEQDGHKHSTKCLSCA